MKSHLEDIISSPIKETDTDKRSSKNSKRELSISPDNSIINKNEKNSKI